MFIYTILKKISVAIPFTIIGASFEDDGAFKDYEPPIAADVGNSKTFLVNMKEEDEN